MMMMMIDFPQVDAYVSPIMLDISYTKQNSARHFSKSKPVGIIRKSKADAARVKVGYT